MGFQSDLEMTVAAAAYAQGFSGSEIAEAIRRSEDTVWRMVKASGEGRRPRRRGRAGPIERAQNIATIRAAMEARRSAELSLRVEKVEGVGHGEAFVPMKDPAVAAPVAQHHSAGKPKFGLVPPRALEQCAYVMTEAEAKYPPDGDTPNYLIGEGCDPIDYIESALRHLMRARRGEVLNDTGRTHLAHGAIDALIALELMYHQGKIS